MSSRKAKATVIAAAQAAAPDDDVQVVGWSYQSQRGECPKRSGNFAKVFIDFPSMDVVLVYEPGSRHPDIEFTLEQIILNHYHDDSGRHVYDVTHSRNAELLQSLPSRMADCRPTSAEFSSDHIDDKRIIELTMTKTIPVRKVPGLTVDLEMSLVGRCNST